jgi:nitrogen fixation protein
MIRLSDNLEINKPAPVDDRLGVFVSTASALTSVPEDRRYIGLTVIVDSGSGANEYWFKEGVTNADLEAKSTGGGGGGVPYTGATQNVDLGTYNLTADQLALNVNPTGALSVGMTEWNDTIGSSQTLLKGGSVTLKNGVDLVARVVNKVTPNTTLTKANYQVVKVTGAQGQRLAVDLAQGNNDLGSADTIGVVIETIATNQEGFIMTVGQIEGINTTGSLQGETWADGDVLYLSPTTAGRMTNIKPNGSTGHIVVLGYVEYSHANNGKIYVKIMNGWELDELHNVYIDPATLANNDVLVYDSTAELWQNTKPWLIGAPYTIYNSSAAAAIATTIDFTINTSQLRNGSTIILQGYMSRASGTGTATFSWTANSNANIASQSFTSGTQYGIQFYWTAKYILATDSLRFFRTPTTSFVNNTTNATTFFDVAASGGVFTINFRATVTAGSMTGATENLTAQIIY